MVCIERDLKDHLVPTPLHFLLRGRKILQFVSEIKSSLRICTVVTHFYIPSLVFPSETVLPVFSMKSFVEIHRNNLLICVP